MQKMKKNYIVLFFALSILFAGVFGVGLVFATNPQGTAGKAPFTTSAVPTFAPMVTKHVVNMGSVPAATTLPLQHPVTNATHDNGRPAGIEQLKVAAAHNPNAPVAPFVYPTQQISAASVQTAGLTTSFQGMADSSAICPPNGCAAPDQALAVSPTWVLQGVNTSFAVYSSKGTLQSGWPKNAQNFFGVPNPPNNCATVPYLVDERAFYDPNDGRFWAAVLQDENALASYGDNCPFQALYWIGVSQTSDPNGAWNVYSFDMSNGTTNGVDFTEFGFDAQAAYFTGNMFNQSGSTFQYAEVFAVSKALMESGANVTPHGFSDLKLNGVAVDSVQPVETEARSYSGPNVGLFINSLNYNFGSSSCSSGCQGLVVWAVANPTSASPSITSAFLNTNTYTLPPYADQPGCTHCIDTDETQILSTPIYHNGLISFALNTGVNNGTQVVPGIFWGQVSPIINEDTGNITSASMWQSGYFDYSGDTAACYGALMPDGDGNLFMVFDRMSSSLNPEVDYVSRRVIFSAGLFHDAGTTLKAGDARFSSGNLWGDFDATSYDGPGTDNVWFAGEYSSANGDWSTYIGEGRFILTNPSPGPSPTPSPSPTQGSGTYRSAVLADNPFVYYRLDESGGTTATDSSGNGHNGTYTNNAHLSQSGATSDGDTAISGSGRTMQCKVCKGLPTGAGVFSIELWFKTTATPSSPYGSTLISWGTESTNKMVALKIFSSTQLKLASWSSAYYFTVPQGANTLDGNWHYLVATFDGTNGTLYYDGQSLGSQTVSFNIVLNSAGLVLGSQTGGTNDNPYNGYTDEVAVYKKVLSATQIQTHYQDR
ncbi:MAG TPA: LamG domain-containing protein [Ktedonobacteraceae bacterium]|nr:LamG domain-containing protein [Ktedonobacteraceae bacterium]